MNNINERFHLYSASGHGVLYERTKAPTER